MEYTGWAKGRFTVVSKQNSEFILVLLYIFFFPYGQQYTYFWPTHYACVLLVMKLNSKVFLKLCVWNKFISFRIQNSKTVFSYNLSSIYKHIFKTQSRNTQTLRNALMRGRIAGVSISNLDDKEPHLNPSTQTLSNYCNTIIHKREV